MVEDVLVRIVPDVERQLISIYGVFSNASAEVGIYCGSCGVGGM